MKNILKSVVYLFMTICISCQKKNQGLTITVKNTLDFNRKEMVAIKYSNLVDLLANNSESNIRIKNQDSTSYVVTQWIDNDGDGKNDELLFQANVKAKSIVKYSVFIDSTVSAPKTSITTYSRFVPERIDDYAWENNRVAFRVYGPVAQQLAEDGKEGGTLSSGVDLWLKKVDYSIIDKWYKKNVQEPGYYHIDHGEGYDPYHVGASRGTGGSGIWEMDSLHVAKNYISYKTIATGPLRTIFELTYAPWSKYGVKETKRISLDLDSNFSKFEITLQSQKELPNYTLGITLHDKKGEININKLKGWFRYWEGMDDSFIGEGIVLNPTIIDTAFANDFKTKDQSNLLIVTNPEKKLTYYAGFTWTGSKQITDVTEWDRMLNKQAEILSNPLHVVVK